MKNRSKSDTRKTVAKIIVFLLAFVAVALLLLNIDKVTNLFRNTDRSNGNSLDYSDGRTVYINGEPFVPKDSITSFLVMCLDTEGEMEDSKSYINTVQNDFLMLVVLDSHEHSYSIVQINRDTMTDIPVLDIRGQEVGSVYEQIALAHTYGNGLEESCENTVKAVSDLLYGVKIDDYAAMTMSAIPHVNDYFGGVDVLVEDDMTMIDPALVKGETVHLTGQTALNFVRARGQLEDSTNITRMSRHRAYVDAILEKIKLREDAADAVTDVFNEISPYMLSNVRLNDMKKLSENIGKYTFGGIIVPEGKSVVGETYMEFYADDESIKEIVTELFYDPVQK